MLVTESNKTFPMKFPHFLPLLNFPLGPHLCYSESATSVGDSGLRAEQLSCVCSVGKGGMEGDVVQTAIRSPLAQGTAEQKFVSCSYSGKYDGSL